MGSYEEIYLSKRPQSLCNKCGKCCRVATTTVPYQELKRLAKQGDKGAIDFLSLFEPYASVEDAKAVHPDVVDNFIEKMAMDGFNDELTFYYCKYLQPDNLCSRYENRLDLCKHCPATPWSILPPDCGFEGWLFLEREEKKHKVRLAKEEILELKLLHNRTKDEETLKKIDTVIQKIQRNIDLYKKYGSENW
jgi:Fe-S-cluster containining protein